MDHTKCTADKILNPISGRCVSKTGKIGLTLLTKTKYQCNKIGMIQDINTCWFNSIFNNLLLSQKTNTFLLKKYSKLPTDQKRKIESTQLDDTCPLKLRKYHFYRYLYKYNQILENIPYRHPQKLINDLELRSVDWEKERQEWDPRVALELILPIIFEPYEYRITDIGYQYKPPTIKTKLIFIQYNDEHLTPDVDKLNTVMVIPNTFTLDHVVIDISFQDLDHVVSGYICNNEYFIYDSNESIYYKVDWRNKIKIKSWFNKIKKYKKYGQVSNISYSYVCYGLK